MKKSFLTLLISATLVLSACDDKATTELTSKLQQAEQQIGQLKSDLAKSQQDLTALQKAENQNKDNFPSLNVEIYPFFKKNDVIKFSAEEQKKQEQELGFAREESNIIYFISLANTGVEWLDNLIARQVLLSYSWDGENSQKLDPNAVTGKENAELKAAFEKNYQENLAELKAIPSIGIEHSVNTFYLGQRNNIVSFSQAYFEYNGGAHGMHYTNYLNIDVNKKRLISLDDLISQAKHTEIKEALWQAYEDHSAQYSQGTEKVETFTPKSDFEISDNFYFNGNGIVFVYPPYALGPYSEGEIELTLYWHQVNSLINKDYQLTEKDGFGLHKDSLN